jgi:hypothetical protein
MGEDALAFKAAWEGQLERTDGIEPTPPLGKSGALPLSYVREIYLTAH